MDDAGTASLVEEGKASGNATEDTEAHGPRERRKIVGIRVMETLVEAASGKEFVDEEAVGASDAVSEKAGEVGVVDASESVHLGAKFTKALEGSEVRGKAFDGDGSAGGEDGLVDKAKATVAKDAIRGKVFGGGRQIGEGDVGEGGIEGKAVLAGGERKGGGRGGKGYGEERGRWLRWMAATEEEDDKE